MKIAIQKIIKVQEEINYTLLKVEKSGRRDIDSINIKVYYGPEEIGFGYIDYCMDYIEVKIKVRTTNLEDNGLDLDDYIKHGIRTKSIPLN